MALGSKKDEDHCDAETNMNAYKLPQTIYSLLHAIKS
jgi:hypothetical protein